MLNDADQPLDAVTLARLEGDIDAWLADQLAENPAVDAVERGEPGARRWYVRLHGEQKDVFTIWLTLRQRRLHFETYLLPAPAENEATLYEHLLRRNHRLEGVRMAIGDEDAVYLMGEMPAAHVDQSAIDTILGLLYEATERCFRPAMRIAFASRFRG